MPRLFRKCLPRQLRKLQAFPQFPATYTLTVIGVARNLSWGCNSTFLHKKIYYLDARAYKIKNSILSSAIAVLAWGCKCPFAIAHCSQKIIKTLSLSP